jgi:hypothetical protein
MSNTTQKHSRYSDVSVTGLRVQFGIGARMIGHIHMAQALELAAAIHRELAKLGGNADFACAVCVSGPTVWLELCEGSKEEALAHLLRKALVS